MIAPLTHICQLDNFIMRYCIYILLATSLVGCHQLVEPGKDFPSESGDGLFMENTPITTRKQVYSIAEVTAMGILKVETSYVNRTQSDVFMPQCFRDIPPFSFEKRTNEGWVDAYTATCVLVGRDPIHVKPGGTYTVAIPFSVLDSEVENLPGTYRLVWHIRSTKDLSDNKDILPIEKRISNAFKITQ